MQEILTKDKKTKIIIIAITGKKNIIKLSGERKKTEKSKNKK